MTENPQRRFADESENQPAEADRAENQPTGDIVIDAALEDLRNASPDDLDAQIEAGQRVHQTLQARLSDLGGE